MKSLAETVATLIVLPIFVLYWTGSRLMGPARVFPFWTQLVSLWPGLSGVYVRRAFYRLVFRRCDDGASIGFGTVFSHPDCSIGRNSFTGAYCSFGEVTIDDDVLIGSHVSIVNGSAQHGIERLDIPIREQPGVFPHITIGRDTWIGDRAVIMANVGRHCVIGAGSVVTKPVPDYAIVAGNPAKVLRMRTEQDAAEPTSTRVPELDVH